MILVSINEQIRSREVWRCASNNTHTIKILATPILVAFFVGQASPLSLYICSPEWSQEVAALDPPISYQ